MILVDTSIWVDHFGASVPKLVAALESDQVLIHPFIVGELACGSLPDREQTLQLLQQLRHATVAEPDEVLAYIATHRLYGRGIGYVDAHLLASVGIDGAVLWTRDKRLHAAAVELGLASRP